MGLSSIQQLQALGILPQEQTPPAPQMPPSPTPTRPPLAASPMDGMGEASMPMPPGATPTAAQAQAATPGMGNIAGALMPALTQSDDARRAAAAPDAASTVQALDAAKDATSPPQGLYGPPNAPAGPPPPPQGLYGPPQGAPASAPAQTAPTPPVAPPGPVAPPQPMTATPDASAPEPQAPQAPQGQAPASGGKYAPAQITAALIKAGVPPDDANTLTAVSGAESSYNPSAVGPKNRNGTTDYGLFQINSAHGDLNPASLPGADLDTQAQAAAAVYKKEGLGAWSTYNDGRYKTFMGGTQFAGPGAPPSGSPSGNLQSAQNAMGGGLSNQADAIGINPDEIMSMATKLGYKPTDNLTGPGDKYIAMGLGMMGGRTMADSFKNAGEAYQGMRGQDIAMREKQNSNAMSMAQVGINDARMNQQMRMQAAQNALGNRRADQQQVYQNAMLGIKQEGQANATARVDGTAAANIAGAKEASADVQELMDGQQAGTLQMQKIDQVQKLLTSGQVSPGPTGAAQMKTALGNLLGVSINGADPNANQMLQQAISSARGSGIMGKNMRTQKEFDTVMQGMLNFDKQGPEAMGQVLNSLRNISDQRIQAGQAFYKLPQDQQTKMRRDPVVVGKFMQDQADKWSQTMNQGGGMYTAKDPTTGLGFTIH